MITVAGAGVAQARHARRARSMKEAESSTRSEAENEPSKSGEAAAPGSDVEDGKPSKATAKGRSPFGIREFLGRFIQIERQVADNANVELHASDEDSPLRANPDEISAEDDDPETKVDEENASVAMDEAEASIPQELREAQERAEGEVPTYASSPRADSVGAGDSCCAAIVTGLLQKWPWDRIVGLSNRVGAYVASQQGATPRLPREILSEL
ncbi:MAG: carbohydrate kinase family protein [Planctomycetes bacterium]|nr:carbohydrate kinase family protein [Planctomycetota bacterium]